MGGQGTAEALEAGGVKCERVLKIQEGRPNAGDLLKNGEIQMMLLTTKGTLTLPLASFPCYSSPHL